MVQIHLLNHCNVSYVNKKMTTQVRRYRGDGDMASLNDVISFIPFLLLVLLTVPEPSVFFLFL